MKTVATALFVLIFVTLFQTAAVAELIPVTYSQFGTSTVRESFEETPDASNSEVHSNSGVPNGIVVVGKYHDYLFSQSGITLTNPIPDIIGNFLPMISQYKAQQGFGLGSYGAINSSNLPPDGNKFLVEYGSSSIPFAPYELTLPGNGATKVGGYWFMYGNTPGQDKIQVDAYGLTNNLLGSALISVASVSDGDWSNNFYGFKASDGSAIKKIGINYWTGSLAGNPGVDMLMFEPYTAQTPEPGTWAMMVGLVSVIGAVLILRPLFAKKTDDSSPK